MWHLMRAAIAQPVDWLSDPADDVSAYPWSERCSECM